jgi:2-iminobutanoate/2-iminopropanoate deaminase
LSQREIIATTDAPGAIGPYSQAVRIGDLLFCSGQVGTDPASGMMAGASVPEQAEQIFKNLAAVLKAGGSGLDRVVKTTVFLTTMDHFAELNEVYGRHFPDRPPARSTIAVVGLPRGALVEIEAIAH